MLLCSIQYHPSSQASTEGLGTYPLLIRETIVTKYSLFLLPIPYFIAFILFILKHWVYYSYTNTLLLLLFCTNCCVRSIKNTENKILKEN
jgi:hypothetical protein